MPTGVPGGWGERGRWAGPLESLSVALRPGRRQGTGSLVEIAVPVAVQDANVPVTVQVAVEDAEVPVTVHVAIADAGIGVAVHVAIADAGIGVAVQIAIEGAGIGVAVEVTVEGAGIEVAVAVAVALPLTKPTLPLPLPLPLPMENAKACELTTPERMAAQIIAFTLDMENSFKTKNRRGVSVRRSYACSRRPLAASCLFGCSLPMRECPKGLG